MYLALLLLVSISFFVFFSKEPFTEPFTVQDTIRHYKSDPFEREIFHPSCCPSTYSSSQGCLCECKTIVNLLASRGGNRMLDPL